MNDSTLSLRVLTPEGVLLDEDNLDGINIPLANGYPIGIRTGHAPLIGRTAPGKISYRQGNRERSLLLHSAVLEIRENMVTLLSAGEIDKIPEEIVQTFHTAYNRLMQTLNGQIESRQESGPKANE